MPAPQPLRPAAFWASRTRATTGHSGGSGASSADVRSAAKPNTPPSSAQARSMLADECEVMPTRAPSETNRRAQAKPIPFEPPVTTTLLPRNPRSIVRLLCPHYTVGEGRGNEKDRCLPSSPQRKALKRRRLTMSGPAQPADEEHHRGGVEERSGGRERGLRVFPKPPVPADPTEEPLHYPPARVHGKADLVRRLAHDLDCDDRRRGRFVAGVASIRKRFGHEGERAPGQAQHRNRSVAILDISGLGFEDQAAPVRVDHDLALAALHL